jgi:hypothetical protein
MLTIMLPVFSHPSRFPAAAGGASFGERDGLGPLILDEHRDGIV